MGRDPIVIHAIDNGRVIVSQHTVGVILECSPIHIMLLLVGSVI